MPDHNITIHTIIFFPVYSEFQYSHETKLNQMCECANRNGDATYEIVAVWIVFGAIFYRRARGESKDMLELIPFFECLISFVFSACFLRVLCGKKNNSKKNPCHYKAGRFFMLCRAMRSAAIIYCCLLLPATLHQ